MCRRCGLPSSGGYHHIGLNTWNSAGRTSPPPPEGHTGLLHVVILFPNRRELAMALKRVLDHGHDAFTGGQHTPAGEAVDLEAPDGNGLELYYDGPREQWTGGKASRSWTKMFLGSCLRKTCLKSWAPSEAPGLQRTPLSRCLMNNPYRVR